MSDAYNWDKTIKTGQKKYNEGQPRDPKGTPTGGQWTATGSGSADTPLWKKMEEQNRMPFHLRDGDNNFVTSLHRHLVSRHHPGEAEESVKLLTVTRDDLNPPVEQDEFLDYEADRASRIKRTPITSVFYVEKTPEMKHEYKLIQRIAWDIEGADEAAQELKTLGYPVTGYEKYLKETRDMTRRWKDEDPGW